MEWIEHVLRDNPSLAVFLTLGIGFFIGQLKYKSFSLGTVTSVLLVGVVVGQLDIPVPGPLKDVFFLLFLFSIGYSVGPQFFRALKGDGLKQVLFAVVVCVLCLLSTWGVAVCMGYNVGEAVGLLAGAQTMSAVIGVGTDTINSLSASAADKQQWLGMIPVCYAVTYVFGTIGSAYILANLGPWLLGGIKKVKAETVELEKKMNSGTANSDPNYINALRPVVFRAYKVTDSFFAQPRSVAEAEDYFRQKGKPIHVERMRANGKIKDIIPGQELTISIGDEIVLSGRREFIIGDESWIGPEVVDAELVDFMAEELDITVASKKIDGMTVDDLRKQKFMYGISIKAISRGGVNVPVLAQVKISRGDVLSVVGLEREVNEAAPQIGYADRRTTKTDLVFVGLGIFIGGLIGSLAIHIGKVPVSLSVSGGALIAGLVLGWLRSKHPTFGRLPRVHRRGRHCIRSIVRHRIERGGSGTLLYGNHSHISASCLGNDHRAPHIQVPGSHKSRMLRRKPHHNGITWRRAGCHRKFHTGNGLHGHICRRQYSSYSLGRGDSAAYGLITCKSAVSA